MNRRALAVWAAGTVVIGLGLTVASSGPVEVWSEPTGTYVTVIDLPPTEESDRGATLNGELPPPESTTNDDWLSRMLAVAGLIVLTYLAYAVISTWWKIWRERERRERVDPTRLTPLDALTLRQVEFDQQAQFDALAHGEPRNAIVAAWLRLETDVAAAGWPRHPAETSAEYTGRVLAAAGLAPDAVHTLAALYREARFSSHPLGEADRERASAALRAVHASITPAGGPR